MGRGRRGLLHAVPPLVAIAALLSLALGGLESLVGRLFDPAVALTVLSAILALAAWRVASAVHAFWLARRRERKQRHHGDPRPTTLRRSMRLVALTVVVATVVVAHAIPAWWAFAFYRAGTAIFQPQAAPPQASIPRTPGAQTPAVGTLEPGPVDPADTPGAGATDGVPMPTPSAAAGSPGTAQPPSPPPSGEDGIVNVLLVGIDSHPLRPASHRFTDTLILASFDRGSRITRMLSVPRGIVRFPLYRGGIHEGKLNELMSAAETDPRRYPDGPMPTLVRQVGFLLGIDVDFYASVDIPGFERLIDSVGGVDVVLEEPLIEEGYVELAAGLQHLDGATALRFVRSRQGTPGGAENRSLRQQQLLLALRKKLSDPANLARLPDVLAAISAAVRTDLPAGRLSEMLQLARQADAAPVEQIVIGPTEYAVAIPTDDLDYEFALELRMDRIAALSRRLWGDASFYSDETFYRRLVGSAIDPG